MSGRDNFTELLDQEARRIHGLSTELPRSLSVKKFPRNLELLRIIEHTRDAIKKERNDVARFSSFFRDQTRKVNAHTGSRMLDKAGSVMETLLSAQRQLKQHHTLLKKRCAAAKTDPRLNADDCVVDEYRSYVVAVAKLHNDINALRLAIAAHDANRAKVVREFVSMEKMIAFMKTQ